MYKAKATCTLYVYCVYSGIIVIHVYRAKGKVSPVVTLNLSGNSSLFGVCEQY